MISNFDQINTAFPTLLLVPYKDRESQAIDLVNYLGAHEGYGLSEAVSVASIRHHVSKGHLYRLFDQENQFGQEF